jgi:hypothetical protein
MQSQVTTIEKRSRKLKDGRLVMTLSNVHKNVLIQIIERVSRLFLGLQDLPSKGWKIVQDLGKAEKQPYPWKNT